MSKPQSKPVRASLSSISDLMNPSVANIRGSVFGGVILAMVDKAAAVCAMRHGQKPCVTIAMERVEFLIPIAVGDQVTAEARINYAGRTSMEIGVEVYSESLTDGVRLQSHSCLVTMVAVDKKGRPSPIPGLILETPGDKARHAEALKRREARLKTRD